ncbi:MAG: DEAD/DEAH box helicase [Bacteroidales bacterium]|jgi:superfamily II DNA or RNA helicase|nr:DEAD/DEAH box helicase [Bacteroidales bacterium]
MAEREFVIVLTEHRKLGYIFQSYMMDKGKSYYVLSKQVRQRDIAIHGLNAEHADMVRVTEQLCDEVLVPKFSGNKNVQMFYKTCSRDMLNNHVFPYISRQMLKIVNALMSGHTRLFLKTYKTTNLHASDEIIVPPRHARCQFIFNRNETGTYYNLELFDANGYRITIYHKDIILLTDEPCTIVMNNRMYAFEHLDSKKLQPFFEKQFIFITTPVEEKYYKTFVSQAIRDYAVKYSGFTVTENCPPHHTILSLDRMLDMRPVICPCFDYGGKKFELMMKTTVSVVFKNENGKFHFERFARDYDWEQEQLQWLTANGLENPDGNGGFMPAGSHLADESTQFLAIIQWLNEHTDTLRERGYEVKTDALGKAYCMQKPELEVTVTEQEDWFDIHATIIIGSFRIPFVKIRRMIVHNIREFELPSGEMAVIPEEWFTQYRDLFPFAQSEGESLHVRKIYSTLMLDNKLQGINRERLEQLRDQWEQPAEVELPSRLNATLRPYQQFGFNWLYHLYRNRFGGCLADDMGLGKTLQTLTFLLKMKEEQASVVDGVRRPSLIVMPASLIHNWRNEIQKFTPSLQTYIHTGNARKRNGDLNSVLCHCDVVLTTYGTVRNDTAMLQEYTFFYLILDESQLIKNPASKSYSAANQLKARFRLTITGTPIENSLLDLWAQINFLNRSMLGDISVFNREFVQPIEKHNDDVKQHKLQLLIRPFVLRRTKSEVADDLPDLTEQTLYCEMSEAQHRIYEREKSAIRNLLLGFAETETAQQSAIFILKSLMRLRQIANHPAMLSNNHAEVESGKLAEIMQGLENIVAENHKVLVFSSFVTHLNIIRTEIEKREWQYSMLVGTTANREAEINRFQNTPDNRIFLLSMKVGGVGLNLTAADYVFVTDPWWNPAVEMQAINRAHRIGQDKKVFVYRFITEDTIEEKIMRLQERKSLLAQKFIQSNNPLKIFSQEEILQLFE